MKQKSLIYFLIIILSVTSVTLALEINKNLKVDTDKLKRFDKVYVSRVIDGDTIEIDTGEKIRFIGVDTPEFKENYGEQAYEFTKKKLEDRIVYLKYDVQKRDKYDRILAYIFLEDGIFFNAKLLQAGQAQLLTIPPNIKYVDLFKELVTEARKNNKGLWSKRRQKEKELPVISWRDAEEYMGKEVIVKGKIVDTYDSKKAIFLNFDSEYHHTFTAVIFASDKHKFDVKLADYYLNKRVKIRGEVKEYKGAPEIIVEKPAQINIITDQSD